jgi:ABC-type branched-subunit amino acid transport system substrate-binding protein
MAIPLSRGEMEFAQKLAPDFGFKVVGLEVIPPPTPDYTPFATKIKEAGAKWVFSWAPWVTQVRTLEALRRLGWDNDYVTWAHLEAEGELVRLKDPKLAVIGANSLYQDNLPIHQEIREAVKKADIKYPAEQMTEGWIAGMVIEAAMKGAGWPADAAKVQASMQNLKVDLKGLRGGPIEWTKENHFRTKQFYRVYRWDAAKNAIVVAKDWFSYDVK